MSSVIVNILRKLGNGARMLDPITRKLIHSVGAMFVDDTDLYCWVESMRSAEELYETIQEETKMWSELLLATGGCLKPEKCFWYALDYECCEGEWLLSSGLGITDTNGRWQPKTNIEFELS